VLVANEGRVSGRTFKSFFSVFGPRKEIGYVKRRVLCAGAYKSGRGTLALYAYRIRVYGQESAVPAGGVQ